MSDFTLYANRTPDGGVWIVRGAENHRRGLGMQLTLSEVEMLRQVANERPVFRVEHTIDRAHPERKSVTLFQKLNGTVRWRWESQEPTEWLSADETATHRFTDEELEAIIKARRS